VLDLARTWIKSQPALYDSMKAVARYCQLLDNDAAFEFFTAFARKRGGSVRFIQIGANDGLRNDPVREFIVGGQWRGVLVEPLPDVFELLKRNYPARLHDRLHFVNAAVSAESRTLPLWSFRKEFLDSLSLEERLFYLRKASFTRSHVESFLTAGRHSLEVIEQVDVPCVTVQSLAQQFFDSSEFDLLVIDAEGHEASILSSIDFANTRPAGIFFESDHLAERRREMAQLLIANGYTIQDLGVDTAATLN